MGSGRLKPGWTRVAFGDVVRRSTERSSNPEAAGVDRYVGLEHLDPGELAIRRWGRVASGTTFTSVFRPGQVLFGKRRAYQRKVAVSHFSGVCSSDIYVLVVEDEDRLLPGLLPFICQTEAFFRHAIGTSAGSLSPRTNWQNLATYEFALPPLDEQRRISHAVTVATALVETLETSVSSCRRLIESLRMFHFDPRRHKTSALARLCEESEGIQIGPFGAQLHQSDYQETGVPVIMPVNMVDGRIDASGIARVSEEKANDLSSYRVRAGDILLPRRGELDRRAYIDSTADGWLCGTGSVRIRVRRGVSPLAVFNALASRHTVRWLDANAVGTTMPNLNSGIVGSIPIALPAEDASSQVVTMLVALENTERSIALRRDQAKMAKERLLEASLMER